MLRTERLRAKLRELGFTFKRQADRVMIWARGVDRVALPRSDYMPEAQARQILRYAGLSDEEIESFLAEART